MYPRSRTRLTYTTALSTPPIVAHTMMPTPKEMLVGLEFVTLHVRTRLIRSGGQLPLSQRFTGVGWCWPLSSMIMK